MIITCENCSTSFNLDEKFLKPSGSKVRCSKCKHIFTAFPATVPQEKEAPPAEVPVDEPEPAAEEAAAADMAPEADAAVADEEAREEAGIEEDQPEDLDFDMDVTSEDVPVAAADDVQAEDLDLTGMGATMDMEAPPAKDAEEDLGLDLDMDTEPEAVKEAESEELDLSGLDEALDMETEPSAETVAETGDDASDDILEDLDLDLEMDTEPQAEKETTEDGLDMSDIKFELGDDADSDTPVEDAELELDLEMEPGVGDLAEEKEELDMAGFEETLTMDSPPEPQADADAGIDDLDLELDLEMEGDTTAEAEAAADVPKDVEEDIEDLDFELDMEFESDEDLEGVELDLDSDDTEDLDMSDIEQMLEVKGDEIAGVEMDGTGLEEEIEVEKWKDSPGEKGPGEDTAEIDLSDLDLDAVSADDVEVEDQELDFDLDEDTIKSAEAVAASGKLMDEPEELDISHFEDLEMEDKDAPGVISEGDIQLEFEIEGDGSDDIGAESTSDVAEPTQQLETIAMDAPPTVAAVAEEEAAEKPKKKKAKKEKKKKVKKTRPVGKSSPVKVFAIVLLLLIIGLGGAVIVLDRYMGIEIPYVTEYVKQIPYVNQLMKPDMKKAGDITTSNIKSKFVDNEESGRLFVITGQVKNEFSTSRRFIKLKGMLFASGKTLVKEETVFGGNSLTDIQLAQMSIADIGKKLSNRFGDNKSNVKVRPGQQLPFMMVFSDFPQDLEEFTIEVVGSSPVQQ